MNNKEVLLCNSYKIPIKANDSIVPRDVSFIGINDGMTWEDRSKIANINNINWSKEQYEKMGINIIDKHNDLLYDVELPKEWYIESSGNSLWNYIMDDMGRKRISFFYKGSSYDKRAFSNFENRFHISSKKADYNESEFEKQSECSELTGYEKYSQPFHYEVYDFDGKVLFESDVVKTDYEHSNAIHCKFYDHLEEVELKAKEQCKEWLRVNYPAWENWLAYWDM